MRGLSEDSTVYDGVYSRVRRGSFPP